MKSKKTLIGITGDIGAGKSTVTSFLREKGYFVIDADQVARDVLLNKDHLLGLKELFPEAFVKDELQRSVLGEIVFSSEVKRSVLNNYMHPIINEEINRQIEESTERILFVDSPLLFETGMDEKMDYVLYIHIDPQLQKERIHLRDGHSYEHIEKRMAAFDSSESKMKKSHVLINNDSKLLLFKRVEEFLKIIDEK